MNISCNVPECLQCPTLGRTPLATLDGPQLASLSSNKRCRSYDRGEIIHNADDRATGVFCVYQGTVKIYKLGSDGREQIVRLAGSGDTMGYRAFLSGDRYQVYAEPLTSARICHIPGTSIRELLSSNQKFTMGVLQLLAFDLKAAEQKIVEMAQQSSRSAVRYPGCDRMAWWSWWDGRFAYWMMTLCSIFPAWRS